MCVWLVWLLYVLCLLGVCVELSNVCLVVCVCVMPAWCVLS
jgi:hypothetical protein